MSEKQVRAQYTREFKLEAVRQVRRLRWWPKCWASLKPVWATG
jgi:hypothetical protein